MYSLNPQLTKKSSQQKKKTLIRFDATNEMDTEEDVQQTFVESFIKRQNKLLE